MQVPVDKKNPLFFTGAAKFIRPVRLPARNDLPETSLAAAAAEVFFFIIFISFFMIEKGLIFAEVRI